MPPKVNPLYGQVGSDLERFDIAGDPRRMYPVSAAGSMYDESVPPHKIVAGSVLAPQGTAGVGSVNMITNGQVLVPFGKKVGIASQVAVRLGVSGGVGGNVLSTLNEYGFIWATQRLDAGAHYTYMANGEAAYQDTNAGTPQYGASSESLTPTATTVTVTNGLTSCTASGAAFGVGDAVLPPATYAAYTPSKNRLWVGDIIRIVDGANAYYHRVANVNSATSITLYPAWAGATGGGKSYTLLRSGHGSYSRVVPIYNSANGLFYNYYAGLHASTSFPGTIQCFTREASGAAASTHFTCPQNTAAQDISAVDIAYYKSFMLYGYLGSISWSVAGFPTSFTTGFGATDFPATNTTVVANNDQFISFEYVGEKLIAVFKDSIWEVQPTGSVPEFEFYKFPEPVGAQLVSKNATQTAYKIYRRPSASGRACVYYNSNIGILRIVGSTAENISMPIRAHMPMSLITGYSPGLFWEQSTNSLFCTVDSGTNNSDYGFIYCDDSDSWSIYNPANTTWASGDQKVRGSSAIPQDTGFCVFYYNGADSQEAISQLDNSTGAPFRFNPTNTFWEWSSPVVSMGDAYRDFQFAGFQLDALLTTSVTFYVYGGPTPYGFTLRQTGTIGGASGASTNRQLFGSKIDDAFVQIKITGDSWAALVGANIYAVGRGK